jgi:hypothetical protein
LSRLDDATRTAYLRRAQVWMPVEVEAMDLLAGPQDDESFAFDEEVVCDYAPKKRSGQSAKFSCALASGDVVKVKYGAENGEVFGEVAASRLLWALGFGADRWYPVRVTCRGCSPDPWRRPEQATGESRFELAAIERPMPGHKIRTKDKDGWTWPELELVDEREGGASRAQRDALKLLAVMLQHTDSPMDQQRLICPPGSVEKHADPAGGKACSLPFMFVHDVGLTFGGSHLFFSSNTSSGANLEKWRPEKVWKDGSPCVGNIGHTWGGTLVHPHISEEGREFLAQLLTRLSDRQVHDLFRAARVDQRLVHGRSQGSIEDWVAAFAVKREEIVEHRCPQ